MHQTPFYFQYLLSTTVLTLSFSPLLDCERDGGDITDVPGYNLEVVYEEPDLTDGIGGVDYRIEYGVGGGYDSEEY